jgi:hypothetical protein
MVGHMSDTRLERIMFTGHACLENRTRVMFRKGPWLMFSHASCNCEVFQCATKGYFSLVILFKEVPTPSILCALVINGNIKFSFILITIKLIVELFCHDPNKNVPFTQV